ncbi:(Fe-S)-binding protein [Longirhabdus pacifica]|uniref:(Fe-S)-binding protein n=1 Tax=Longirhabdus pacifica TaxID=2305227 RepID=UPI00100923CB|nr:heterodisulfide reductase-related iron-sulfur binding cluster [Longirhabdus pacifica]
MLSALHTILFALVTLAAVAIFVKVVRARFAFVQMGQKVEKRKTIDVFITNVFGQKKLLKDKKSGIMHVFIFYGFIILQFGALDIIVRGIFNTHLPMPKLAYEIFASMQEITVVLILLAVGYGGYRRYIEQLSRLKRGWKPSLVLFFIFFLMLSVVFTLTFDRIRMGEEFMWHVPVTSALLVMLQGLPELAINIGFYVSWWAHLLILLAFLIYVPQSKHFHLITGPVNMLYQRTGPVGKLEKIDFENEEVESYGVEKIEDFTQKQLLDLYACVECGRCTNVCPASSTGKMLSPMHMLMKMRDHLTEKGEAVTKKSPWAFAGDTSGVHTVEEEHQLEMDGWKDPKITNIDYTMGAQKKSWVKKDLDVHNIQLIGDVMTESELWSCTSCRNCEEQCPVGNEHVDKIIDMRRHLVMMSGNMPSDGQRAMQNIERQGNPWGINRKERSKWIESFQEEAPSNTVPTVKENPDFDILFFVGSMGSYDPRTQKVTKSFTKLLHEAGVNFAVLGNEEKNSGDTPRRMGNEFLFQQLCEENISVFEKYDVKKIVTTCPHTYHALKNEYPDFGLKAEVLHHSELLAQLLQEGKLVPKFEVNETITYHDSCYLGRYNDTYEAPRDILRAIPGVTLVEMERSHETSMCCGAGGGMMWMEETLGKRVNIARFEQAMEVEPSMISSACPYCLTMMEDGAKVKEVEEDISAKDIAEILALSIWGEKPATDKKEEVIEC